ncbi:hypothetical protein TNCV_430161 [Trichonephila clavipes]|nr:hypothetical protein TNCV_430161 [Trichonephila clavipes]
MSRQPTPKIGNATALSTGIKANHPRLRDGCSRQRVKYSSFSIDVGCLSPYNETAELEATIVFILQRYILQRIGANRSKHLSRAMLNLLVSDEKSSGSLWSSGRIFEGFDYILYIFLLIDEFINLLEVRLKTQSDVCGFEVLLYLPCSSDLALSNFLLYPELKVLGAVPVYPLGAGLGT